MKPLGIQPVILKPGEHNVPFQVQYHDNTIHSMIKFENCSGFSVFEMSSNFHF